MSKAEMIKFIRDEVKDYERIMKEYGRKYGKDSCEYKGAEARYLAVWVLANDLGVTGID